MRGNHITKALYKAYGDKCYRQYRFAAAMPREEDAECQNRAALLLQTGWEANKNVAEQTSATTEFSRELTNRQNNICLLSNTIGLPACAI